MSNIILKQKPIIEYSKLDEIGQEIENRLAEYDFENMEITDTTITQVKTLRASLNKEFKEYEDSRKAIKKAVLQPYEDFNKIYEDKIKKLYESTDSKLKNGIDRVEDRKREEKKAIVEAYFNEKNTVDWLTFDRLNINVTLSKTMKSLQTEVDEAIEDVESAVKLIAIQEHGARILARYKNSLNLKEIENVHFEVQREQDLEMAMQVESVPDYIPDAPMKSAALPKPKPIEFVTTTFTVTGTKDQLINLREYMKQEGIKYE